ncbi:MAG: amidohydrolase [Pirellulales bacterium]
MSIPQHESLNESHLSRRGALRRGLAAAGGVALAAFCTGQHGGLALATEDDKLRDDKPGYIDAHSHIWTPDIKNYPLAQGYAVADMQPASFTPEELFAHARPAGVAKVVLIQMSFYGTDNRYMLDSMQAHPGAFSGVAVIDEESLDPAAEMIRLKGLGVRGFRIRPGERAIDKWLYGPGMATMWKTGAAEGLAMCHLINPDSLPHVDKMCQRYPDTPVVIDHFARIGVDGKIGEKELADLCNLARHKLTSVKVSAFYALGKKKAPYTDLGPMIRKLLDAYGPERLMWATDCPYQVDPGHNYQDSVDLIRERLDFLTAGDREWLLRKTAERVFFS